MTIYRRPEGLVDPNPTLAQSLGAIAGTLGGKALTAYSQNRAINKIQDQLIAQGVSPALATLAAAQVGRTGAIGTPIANLIKNQQQTQNLANYYQQRWGLSPDQAINLAGIPESVQKQEIENLTARESLRLAGVYPDNQPIITDQPTVQPAQPLAQQRNLPGLPGLALTDEFAQNLPPSINPPQQPQQPSTRPATTTTTPTSATQRRLSPAELQRLGILQPKAAEELRKQYESEDRLALDQRKASQKDRDYALQTNSDFLKQVDGDRETYEQKQAAVNSLGAANTSGNLGTGFSFDTFRNVISKFPGLQGFRTSDAATYDTAVKSLVIADVKEIGSKNNQLIDKNMIAAAGNVLDNDSSRYIIQFGLQGGLNKQAEKIRITDEIIADDTAKYGYVQPNLSQRVYQRAKNFYSQEDKRTLEKMKKAKEGYGFYYARDFSDPNNYLNAPAGTPLTTEAIDFFLRKNNMDPRQAEADAYRNGYRPKGKPLYLKGIKDFML